MEILHETAKDRCRKILELHETFEDADHIFIVTAVMAGGDLLNYLIKQKSQPLSEEHVRKIVRQVAIGIEGLHKKNIIHRDIKLHNILMSDSSENAKVRIADFGSACKLESKDGTSNFRIGTPGFIAPEVVRGQSYGLGCDIWSLGALMHSILFAECPFWDENDSKRNIKLCNSESISFEGNELADRLSEPCK